MADPQFPEGYISPDGSYVPPSAIPSRQAAMSMHAPTLKEVALGTAVAAGVVGLTVATGGLDLVAAGGAALAAGAAAEGGAAALAAGAAAEGGAAALAAGAATEGGAAALAAGSAIEGGGTVADVSAETMLAEGEGGTAVSTAGRSLVPTAGEGLSLSPPELPAGRLGLFAAGTVALGAGVAMHNFMTQRGSHHPTPATHPGPHRGNHRGHMPAAASPRVEALLGGVTATYRKDGKVDFSLLDPKTKRMVKAKTYSEEQAKKIKADIEQHPGQARSIVEHGGYDAASHHAPAAGQGKILAHKIPSESPIMRSAAAFGPGGSG